MEVFRFHFFFIFLLEYAAFLSCLYKSTEVFLSYYISLGYIAETTTNAVHLSSHRLSFCPPPPHMGNNLIASQARHYTLRALHSVPVMGVDMTWYVVLGAVKGTRRVNVLMKRGGQALQEHMKRVIDQSGLQEPGQYAKDLDERGTFQSSLVALVG